MPAPRKPIFLGFLTDEPHRLNQGWMKVTQYRRDDWKYELVGRSFENVEKRRLKTAGLAAKAKCSRIAGMDGNREA